MTVVTYEGVVENGQIRLPAEAKLPENAKVYVLVPGITEPPTFHIRSPHLADPAHAARFKLEVVEDRLDAGS
jgi:hypothetical protein